ncbi:MAG: hypothetical protein WD827_08040 [Solirubrobacterales bacterium]
MRRLVAIAALVLGLAGATGCGPNSSSEKTDTAPTATTPPEHETKQKAPKRKQARPSNGSLLGPGASQSFASLAASMPAEIGLALVPLGHGQVETLGPLQGGHAWSTIKVPILVTLMRGRGAEGLTPEERGWAADALQASDNEAAASLFGQLEKIHGGLEEASAAIEKVLGVAGDHATTVTTAPPPPGAMSTYGQTEWSLERSALFFRSLANGCLLDSVGTEYVLDLMGGVVPEQRWGLGEAGFDSSWQLGFKGGWGPEAGSGAYLVRQAGILREGGSGVAVAIAAEDDSGSFEVGAADLTRLAAWVRENLNGLGPAGESC